ncbi:universal stress protein [Dactylosporangium sp. NPDC049742]|uniref:universal stress protein n=1 Tax=Dactylosporangium sp. NPDC049742 TaxID=3154737 RepID=UPI0034492D68
MTKRALVCYDGSAAANAALRAGTQLLPDAHAWIAYLWTPPFAEEGLRRRLWAGQEHIEEFVEALLEEGAWRAEQVVATGVTIAGTAGWRAEPLARPTEGGEGFELAKTAAALEPDVVIVGSRGLGGVRAVLGSVSDVLVHYSPKPVLVVPHPMLMRDAAAIPAGPVVVGWDGSPGASAAVVAADRLLPEREVVLVSVHDRAEEWPSTPPPDGSPSVNPVVVRPGSGAPGHAIADALGGYAADRSAALVVVGSRGRSAAQEIMLGSVAMATLHHAHRPVLVVPRAHGAPAGAPAGRGAA